MSTSPNGPQHYVTPEDVDAWLLAAQERRARLDQQAALAPWHSDERQEVFVEMSALLQEAFEEVRVVSESTREWSQGVRGEAIELRTHAAQLMERGVMLMARMAQFAPPSPETLREAESQFLVIFRDGRKPKSP